MLKALYFLVRLVSAPLIFARHFMARWDGRALPDLPPNEKGIRALGYIAYASPNGHYSGCLMRRFRSVDALNAFAKAMAEANTIPLFVSITATPTGEILAVMDRVLTADELEFLSWYDQHMTAEREKFLAGKEEERDKARDAAEAKARENAELIELGKRCRANHSKKGD